MPNSITFGATAREAINLAAVFHVYRFRPARTERATHMLELVSLSDPGEAPILPNKRLLPATAGPHLFLDPEDASLERPPR